MHQHHIYTKLIIFMESVILPSILENTMYFFLLELFFHSFKCTEWPFTGLKDLLV